jgi:hypothetical protein
VERIRVAISDLPGVLHDIIASTVTAADDMALVDDISDGGLDVLIELHDADSELEHVPELLVRNTRSRVVSVGEHGRESVLWELWPRRVPLPELSPDELLDAIRASVRRGTDSA